MKNVINVEWLMEGLKATDGLSEHYLDLQTGDVLMSSELESGMEEFEEQAAAMEEDPDRFERIEPLFPHEAWKVMQSFIETQAPQRLVERLTHAIHAKRPFRRFKDALADQPDLLEQWYAFESRHYLALAEKWLEDRGLLARAEYPPYLKALKD